MKSLMSWLVFAAIAVAAMPARAADEAPDAKQLTELLEWFLAGASRNDIGVHERFWADELVYTSSAGERTDKPSILAEMKAAAGAPAGPPATYSAEDIRIRQYGDTAIVAFRLVGRTGGDAPATQHYLNTGTFLKRGGEWRAVAWQATREAGDDPAPAK